ncbi:YgaP family membrane protein [Devosia sp. LjRoot3]|uniref:YgaP family membrane protein n=1 Tax=Devosia sp. LjRoot3 TaxID=3342319 RepID=UPI003ECF708B
MRPNIGYADRILRAIIGLALTVGTFLHSMPLAGAPVLQAIVFTVGLVLLLTAAVRFCPLYRLIGVSTCKVQFHD